jgi:transcription initiation factor TFIID subunit TAF12
MDPPDLGALDLSDSDTDALFDTPAVHKTKKQTKDAEASAGEGAAGGKARAKESHYTIEEAREVALRRELESIRNVNKVIEGVVESLQKAKDNMAVRDDGLKKSTVLWLTI